MSRLLVITRPELTAGFSLAGVAAFAAEDVETAEGLIRGWLDAGESGLLAVDEGLLEKMDAALLRRLENSDQLPYLPVPAGQGGSEAQYERSRIAELARRVIGFHSVFKTEKPEKEQR